LEDADLASVALVLASRDEPDVAGLVVAVDVGAVHVEVRVIPPGQSDSVLQELPLVVAPLSVDLNAPTTIVVVVSVLRVVATTDRSTETTHETTPVFVSRHDVGVPEILPAPRSRLDLGASVAASRLATHQVAVLNEVKRRPAVASDEDAQRVAFADRGKDRKASEPVSRARQRVLALEASCFASSQEVPQSTRCSGVIRTPPRSITDRVPLGTTPA
jgi:hypothetical protein